MKYFKKNILDKRLPQGLGFGILVLSLGTIFWLSRNTILFGTKAAVGNIPKDIQISNIDNQHFTVSYTTDADVSGSITYGKDQKLGEVAFDIRDTGTPLPHSIHYINVSSLNPSTKYFFSILSGDKIFNNNASLFEVNTASSSADKSSSNKSLSGTVTLEGGSNPSEAIAYVQSKTSQLLSTLIHPDGSYTIPLNSILEKDLSSTIDLLPDAVLKIRIINPSLESQISLFANQTNPVPPVILSKNYDFSINPEPLASTSASNSAQGNGFPSVETSATTPTIQILTPKASEEFKDQQPTFQGKALPGKDVEIAIESTSPLTATVQADQNGNWEYRPDTKLSPGQHNLTIKTQDDGGLIKTLTRSFSILAEGSQFTEPSISPTPIISIPTPTIPEPTPTETPKPTISITTAPVVTPTLIPITTPTSAPTPIIILTTLILTPSDAPQITTPPIPNSGSSAYAFGFAGISILVGIGSLLFFLL